MVAEMGYKSFIMQFYVQLIMIFFLLLVQFYLV